MILNIALIIIIAMVMIMVPKLLSFLSIFEYTIVHLAILGLIVYLCKTNFNNAILLSLVYLVCMVQYIDMISRELLDTSYTDANINPLSKQKVAVKIMNNVEISSNTKASTVIKIMNSETKAITKLDVLLAFMKVATDKSKEEVLTELFSKSRKNMAIMCKFIIKNKDNLHPVLHALNKSHLDQVDKCPIIKLIENVDYDLSNEDKILVQEIKTSCTKKVTFNL